MRSLRSLVTGLPPTFWFLWVGTLINRLGGFVYPFLILYLTQVRGMPATEAAQIVALFGAGSFVASGVGGVLADRIGRRLTLLIALFGGGTVMLALGLVEHPAAIAACTFLLALVQDMYRPAVNAIIADLVPPAERARAFGWQYWAINLGFSIASVLGGVMATREYLWLFVGDAATTFVCGVVILLKVPETRPDRGAGRSPESEPESGPSPARLGGDALAPFRDGAFTVFAALTFFITLLFFQTNVGMPLDMKAHGLSEWTFGLVIALNGVMIVLFQPFASRVTGGWRRSVVMAVSTLFIGTGFGLYGLWTTAGAYAVGVVIFTVGEIIQAGVAPTIVSDLAPARLRGTYQGVYHMAWGLASMVGPLGGGLILGAHGAPTLWFACFAVGLAGAAGHLLIAGGRRRRLVELRAAAVPVSALED